MIKRIPFTFAVIAASVLLGCVLIFHMLVLAGVVPFEMVWGGRLQSASQMRVFESVSIVMTLVLLATVAMRGGHVPRVLPARMLAVVLWVFVVIFALNTVGNLFALHTIEALVGTPLTLLTALFCWRMALEPWPRSEPTP